MRTKKEVESHEMVVCFETGEEITGEDKQMLLKALELSRKQKALDKQFETLKIDLKSMYVGKGAILIGNDFKMQVIRKESISIDDHEALAIALGADKFQAAVKVETKYKPTEWLKEHLRENNSQMRLASKCCAFKESIALEFKPVSEV